MSTHVSDQRITSATIQTKKGKGSIVFLTAYTAPMAEMMDLSIVIKQAFADYALDVRDGVFSTDKHCFGVNQ